MLQNADKVKETTEGSLAFTEYEYHGLGKKRRNHLQTKISAKKNKWLTTLLARLKTGTMHASPTVDMEMGLMNNSVGKYKLDINTPLKWFLKENLSKAIEMVVYDPKSTLKST